VPWLFWVAVVQQEEHLLVQAQPAWVVLVAL
jgi:hypothetical protein